MDENWWKAPEELDQDQKNVVGLPLRGSYLIKGPPGCGKTNLLLLRANYLVNSGLPNISIVTFNRTLQEFISSGADRYDFEPRNVMTSFAFFSRLLSEANADVKKSGNFEIDRTETANRVDELTKGREPIYDAIFLDEAQDYLPTEIAVFKRLCKDIFMVADSRQRIYDVDGNTALEGHVNKVVELRHHYRSGRQICELADRVGRKFTSTYELVSPTCNYNEAADRSKVEVFKGSFDQQVAEIARRLSDQRRVYPNSILGVITPRKEEVKRIAEVLASLGFRDQLCVQNQEEGYQPLNLAKPIWVSTIHSAKGLEFRTLHMVAMENLASMGPVQKRLAFTGLTRAKTSLVVYHDRALPNYLAGALAEIMPNVDAQPLEAAFGRK